MRRVLSRALVLFAVTAAAALGADNSIGAWKANLAKSKYSPAPIPLKSYTIVREAAPGGVKVTITGERADGAPISAGYTARMDGTPATVSGSGTPYDTVAIQQVDASNFTYDAKQSNGKYRSSGRIMISRDLKTMTLQVKGTDANGAAMTLSLILEKQ